ncbi:MAG: S8 family peptidase [Sandaracinaceae bacterium]|nr:MAG: S8 family peptidase [Sandaracinaceae bacterium]
MASKRDRQHIQVPAEPWRTREAYTPHGGGGPSKKPGPPAIGRPSHGKLLEHAIEDAATRATQRRAAAAVDITGATPGMYLEFESSPGWDLALQSMEKRLAKDPRRHIELVAVTEHVEGEGRDAVRTQRAAVFVPDGEVGHFLRQLEKYVDTSPKKPRERRHENVYDRVARVRLAALRALWTDVDGAFPDRDDAPIWWEVWLRRTDGREVERLYEYCAQTGASVSARRIEFDDRIVTLVYASPNTLAGSLDVMGDIAELQRAKETATFFVKEKPGDQAEWTKDLAARTTAAQPDAPAVCLLDTGVNAGHPLLEGSLAPEDRHACDPTWGVDDVEGHGTEMAGLALYGDLVEHLAGDASVPLRHRLESVKILPPTGANDPDLYGAVTAEATSRPEIRAPKRRRVFSMAVTATDGRDRGQPTSWSAAVDALAAGRSFDPSDKGLKYIDEHEEAFRRLFVLSAGNIEGPALERDHISRSDVEPVHDPAQAWNALTVGAFTDKAVITDPNWDGWSPVAGRGDLSPWSTTSVVFQPAWPIKPEVVFEGGNVVHDAADNVDSPCDDLCLLTTYYKPAEKTLVSTWATSAATAQAARFCAAISAEYPDLWPETIRALAVHSAEWTEAMRGHLANAGGKAARAQLVRRYGFGVPDVGRALRSASNAVTLVTQDSIRPFDDGRMREIHFHDLPWPREALAALGDAAVRVRVTLSYFIEPNPGRRGWQTKHRYQSHGLRFEVKGPTESLDEFRKRLNRSALDEEENRPSSGADNDGWYLGPRARNRGSVHSDILTGFAADIAERGTVAVYPVTGWWKELKKRDRSAHGARYTLVVSIETDEVDADIWTPVANLVGVPAAIET